MPTQLNPIKNYILERCLLKSHTGQNINLALNYIELNLFESIFSPVIIGSIVVVDKFNFITYGPIIGGEEIELKIKNVPKTDDVGDAKRKVCGTFTVLSVEHKTIQNNRTQIYEIKFCSKESIYNQLIRVSTTFFQLKYSEMVDRILKIMFKEIKKLDPKERTVHDEFVPKTLYKVPDDESKEPKLTTHFPNLHPFDCISYLTGKAHWDDKETRGNPYFFYESLDRKFYFGSYKSHLETFDFTKGKRLDVNDIKKDGNKIILFNNNQVNITNSAFAHDEMDFYTAIRNEFPKDLDFFENTKKGVYAHKLFTYDYTEQLIKKYTYNYKEDYKKLPRIYKPPTQALMKEEGAPLFKNAYYPNSFVKTAFFQSQAFLVGKNDFWPEKTKTFRYNKMQEFNGNYYQMNLPGDVTLTCGTFYDFYLNSPDTTTGSKLKSDPHFCGTYFCLKIKHCFKPDDYVCSLEIVRDSFMEKTLQTFPKAD